MDDDAPAALNTRACGCEPHLSHPAGSRHPCPGCGRRPTRKFRKAQVAMPDETAATPPRYHCRITIGGPGLAINGPLRVIQDALEVAGFPVEVVNEHPWNGTADEQRANVARCREQGLTGPVQIVMDHQPWGG